MGCSESNVSQNSRSGEKEANKKSKEDQIKGSSKAKNNHNLPEKIQKLLNLVNLGDFVLNNEYFTDDMVNDSKQSEVKSFFTDFCFDENDSYDEVELDEKNSKIEEGTYQIISRFNQPFKTKEKIIKVYYAEELVSGYEWVETKETKRELEEISNLKYLLILDKSGITKSIDRQKLVINEKRKFLVVTPKVFAMNQKSNEFKILLNGDELELLTLKDATNLNLESFGAVVEVDGPGTTLEIIDNIETIPRRIVLDNETNRNKYKGAILSDKHPDSKHLDKIENSANSNEFYSWMREKNLIFDKKNESEISFAYRVLLTTMKTFTYEFSEKSNKIRDEQGLMKMIEYGKTDCGGHTMLFSSICLKNGLLIRSAWYAQHILPELYLQGMGWLPIEATSKEINSFGNMEDPRKILYQGQFPKLDLTSVLGRKNTNEDGLFEVNTQTPSIFCFDQEENYEGKWVTVLETGEEVDF